MDRRCDLNTADVGEILEGANVSRQLGEAVLANRPYADAEGLLRVAEIRNLAAADELVRLMTCHDAATNRAESMADNVSAATVEDASAAADRTWSPGGHSYETDCCQLHVAEFQRDGQRLHRYTIADRQGTELVSAAFLNETELDESTVRFFGLPVWELSRCPKSRIDTLLQKISGDSCQEAARMFQKEMPVAVPEQGQRCFSMVSQLLAHFVGFIRIQRAGQLAAHSEAVPIAHEAAAASAEPPDPTDPPTNGCTASPDFDFVSCCNGHDVCYGIGGTEENRLQCDVSLRDCISGKGHSILAFSYFQAVRTFGGNFFSFHSLPDPGEIPDGGLVNIVLERVSYTGADIGSDIRLEIGIPGDRKFYDLTDHQFDRGTTQSFQDTLFSQRVASSGKIRLPLEAVVIEEDPLGFEDRGSTQRELTFQATEMPDAGLEFQVVVEVPGRFFGTAVFRFILRIERAT